jgi:hypothetical protein
MKFALPIATAAAFALAAPALASVQEDAADPAVASQTEDTADAAEEAVEDRSRKICKTYTVTGSRLAKKKVCRTAYEWKLYEEETKRSMRQATDRYAAAADNN